MPSTKRALAEVSQPMNKCIRLSSDQLEKLSKSELVIKVQTLEEELEKAIKSTLDASNKAAGIMSKSEVKAKVDKARQLMVKGIRSQMKWKPSCKFGEAKFSYSGALPSVQVFNALTNQPQDDKKVKKHLSFKPIDFEDKVSRDTIEASVRYDTLVITSKAVNVRWKEADQTFTVTGCYGKSCFAYIRDENEEET